MNLVRQSIRTDPPFGEPGDPPLPADGHVLFEEELCRKSIRRSRKKRPKHDEPHERKGRKRHFKPSNQEDEAHEQKGPKRVLKPLNQEDEPHEQKGPKRVFRPSNQEDEPFEEKGPKRVSKPSIQEDESYEEKGPKRILKTSSKQELAHADHVEQMIIEASSNKQRRRQSSILNGENSQQIERLLNDENNDWFFEKILQKFEDIRTKQIPRQERIQPKHFDNDAVYGVERIVERRYYMKKPPVVSKRSQLTSTSDLSTIGKKERQPSGASSSIRTSASCSNCSASTPTYVDDLRGQSNSLRYEINGLKSEIEQLQTSQQEFFQHVRTHLQGNPGLMTISENADQPPCPLPTDRNKSFAHRQIPLAPNQLSHSVSIETLSTSSTESNIPRLRSNARHAGASSNPPARPVSEFIATKNPTIASTLSFHTPPPIKPPSAAPTPIVRVSFGSKPSPIVPTPPVQTPFGSTPPSFVPTPSVNASPALKPPSVAVTPTVIKYFDPKISPVLPTSPIARFVAVTNSLPTSPSTPTESVSSKVSTQVRTPPKVVSPRPSPRMATYENELAHRRILSPRSQIVASAASAFGSSDSSSESTTSAPAQSDRLRILKAFVPTLRGNDLTDLVHYSSQLELSGYPPSLAPVVTNPNTSSMFWESVDEYLENSQSTDTIIGLPPLSRSYNGTRNGFDNDTTKQLEKYDLEIKPHEILTSSAPLLLPPLDT